MAVRTMWLTLELEAITDLLSEVCQKLCEDYLHSTKIRSSAVSVHNHRVLVGSHDYPTKFNISKLNNIIITCARACAHTHTHC